jgi:molybdopterin converting factor small subunit
MAVVLLPTALVMLFPQAPRRLEAEGATVGAVIEELDRRWPGMRDRLVEGGPRIRRHIKVWVDGEPATLETVVPEASEVQIIPAISGGA